MVGGDHGRSAAPREEFEPYDLADASWTFRAFPHRSGERRAAEVSLRGTSPAGWLPATVPGLVTEDLLRAGRIPDPYFADRAAAARFIEEQDFVYVRRVILRPEDLDGATRARIVFDSLDTFATVFVNGRCVARHENQFRRLFVDVSDVLRPGDNWIAIAFDASWPATLRRAGPELPHWNAPGERLYVRKSAMSFGWDWAPRVPTVGIAGPVRLELSRGVFADDLWLSGQPVAETGGTITARAEYMPHESFEGEVALFLDGEEQVREHAVFHAGHSQTLTLTSTLPAARRWHPRERGPAHLYTGELRVRRDGRIVHVLQGRVGIRSVALDLGTSAAPAFRLVVNGEPLFVRGENWIPMDLLHTRTSDAELRAYLELLIAGGVNLVRVWGGGIVERRAFYDACDELGLLVWQDFPYACGVYPTDERFLDEARLEAEDVIRRLRSHPSVALWCGNNEGEVLAVREHPELRRHPLFYEILPDVLARLDPERPYWPSSPASVSPEEPPNGPREGDRHDWDVWYGWREVDRPGDGALFCSECGAQSLPQRESLETFLPVEDLWSPGAVGAPHGPSPGALLARHGAQLDKLLSRSADYAFPRNLDAFIAASQALQADTVASVIRRHRVQGSGGVILWNYTSAWPSVCWALVDWYRRPKQAFYAARRAFADVLLAIEPVDGSEQSFALHVSLDRAGELEGSVTLSLRDLATGASVGERTETIQLRGPGAIAAVTLSLPELPPLAEIPALAEIPELDERWDRRRYALVATSTHRVRDDVRPETSTRSLTEEGQPRELREIRYLAPRRLLRLTGDAPDAARAGTLRAIWRNDRVHLVSKAWRLRVGLESYEAPVLWDDNYVDLVPGEERTLELVHGQPEHLWLVADFGARTVLRRNEAAFL